MSETLFTLVQQANAIEQQIMQAGGELSSELETALTNVDLALAEKVDGYSVVIDRLKTVAAYWKEKADEQRRIAQSIENAQERIKNAIKQAMHQLGKTEVLGNDTKFKLVNGRASLVIDDEKLDPSYKMQVTTTIPDKERIRAVLAEGFEVAGARLEPSVSLRSYANRKDK